MSVKKVSISSRDLNQDIGRAKKAANSGPVIITDRGRSAYVLMSFATYQSLTKRARTAAEALAMPGGEDIEFEPQPSRELARAADLS